VNTLSVKLKTDLHISTAPEGGTGEKKDR
jgi:hypothetical protein